jgi:hypothetical protein
MMSVGDIIAVSGMERYLIKAISENYYHVELITKNSTPATGNFSRPGTNGLIAQGNWKKIPMKKLNDFRKQLEEI